MSQRIFKISSSGSNAGIETYGALVRGIVNNAVLHSSPQINQTLPQVTHTLHFFSLTRC